MNQRSRARDDSVIRRPETKSFILTSEFWVAVAAAAGVFFAAYVLDDITDGNSWRYGVWIAIAYIISRGIAKAGSQRDYQPEPFARRSGNGEWGDGHRDEDRRGREVNGGARTSADEPMQGYGSNDRL